MIDDKQIMELFEKEPNRTWSLNDLFGSLQVSGPDAKAFKRRLKSLVREARIERFQGRKYRLSRVGRTLEGRIQIGEDHFAYLIIDGAGRNEPLLPIAREDADFVDDGDHVRCEVVKFGARGRVFAHVVEVLSSQSSRGLGVFRHVGKGVYIEPQAANKRRPVTPIILEEGESFQGAEEGSLVEYEITRRRTTTQTAFGRIVRVLGKPGERNTEIDRILIESDIPLDFSDATLREVDAFEDVSEKDLEGRRDLRDHDFVTIDSETARDFDDAVCARKHKDGFKLFVAIADVTHYVRRGSPLDKDATERGTSVYLPDRVIPMLPERLSNDLCSLKPGVDRLAMVAELDLDRTGLVTATDFYRAVIHSHARLTYTKVAAAIEGEPDEQTTKLLPSILRLYKVSQMLLARRLTRGSIDLDLPEAEVVFDDDGFPNDVVRRRRNDAHRLIEDLMLAANEAVAAFFVDHNLPTVFRIHEDPDEEKLQTFLQLVEGVGIPVKLKKSRVRPKDVARILDQLNDQPRGKALNMFLLRSLAQAKYYPVNEGHYGLAAEHYLHFTSPIRRYPDLMVHRLLKIRLNQAKNRYSMDELSTISDNSSKLERRAMKVERSSKDLDRAYVAATKIGEPLKGNISGVQPFGVFVQVDTPFVEGFIPIQGLGDDYFEIDEHGAALTGKHGGQRYCLGDSLDVQIAHVNIHRRQVELKLVGEDTETRSRRPRTSMEHTRRAIEQAKRTSSRRKSGAKSKGRDESRSGRTPARKKGKEESQSKKGSRPKRGRRRRN